MWRARRGHTSFARQRLVRAYAALLQELLRRSSPAEMGDYLEFGVYHGTTLSSMYLARERLGLSGMRLFGFDSFEGLPASAAEEDLGLWSPGQFRSSLRFTRENLRRLGVPNGAATLIPGWFSETCTPETRSALGIRRAAVVMVDCDLYSSTVDVLDFCRPLIKGEAIFVFDDWNAGGLADQNLGQRRAFEEFLVRAPELKETELHGLNYKDKADPKIFLLRETPGDAGSAA
jgi:hypothetical protein